MPYGNWETLNADLSNVRGWNFVPAHSAGARADVESIHSTWRYYNETAVEAQLDMLKGIGANMVRIFLSHAVWDNEPGSPGFLDKWAHFVGECDLRRLHIMPVLFDHFGLGVEPGANPYNDDLTNWKRYPGTANENLTWATSNDVTSYCTDLILETSGFGGEIIWDVMNEPDPTIANSKLFMEYLADLVASQGELVTVGFAAIPDFGPIGQAVEAVCARSSVHVLSFHPYGVFRENVSEYARMARNVRQRIGGNKPILATEIGAPGILSPYWQAADDAVAVGVGFMHWQAMCGATPTNRPFADGTGLFYSDGQVREVQTCIRLKEIALAQNPGLAPTFTPTHVQKTTFTGLSQQTADAPISYGRTALLAALQPGVWAARTKLTESNTGTLYSYNRLRLVVLDDSLRIKAGATQQSRQTLTARQIETMTEYANEFFAHDLLTGGSTPYSTLEEYDNLWTSWGQYLYQVQNEYRNGPSASAPAAQPPQPLGQSLLEQYRGLGLPIKKRPGGYFATCMTREIIASSVRTILSTRPGERLMLPQFGSRIQELVFEQNDLILESLAIRYVADAIRKWEPRIRISKVLVSQSEHTLQMQISYYIISIDQNDGITLVFPREGIV